MKRTQIYPGIDAGGDHVSPIFSEEVAQTKFLKAVERKYTECVNDLEVTVLPAFEHAFGMGAQVPQLACSLYYVAKVAPEVDLRIMDWCQRFDLVGAVEREPEPHGDHHGAPPPNLDAIAARIKSGWPARRALEALFKHSRRHSSHSVVRPLAFPNFVYFCGQVGAPRTRTSFEKRAWNPEWETQAQAQKRMEAVASAEIRRELHAVKERHCSNLRPVSKRISERHFNWAVMYQVGNRTIKSIAAEEYASEAAVLEAIQNVFRCVRLRKRAGKRGPRRTRTDLA